MVKDKNKVKQIQNVLLDRVENILDGVDKNHKEFFANAIKNAINKTTYEMTNQIINNGEFVGFTGGKNG